MDCATVYKNGGYAKKATLQLYMASVLSSKNSRASIYYVNLLVNFQLNSIFLSFVISMHLFISELEKS